MSQAVNRFLEFHKTRIINRIKFMIFGINSRKKTLNLSGIGQDRFRGSRHTGRSAVEVIAHAQPQGLGIIAKFFPEQIQAAHVFRVRGHADAHADVAVRVQL